MTKDLLEKFEGERKISLEDAENLVKQNLASFQDFGGEENYILKLNSSHYVRRDDTYVGRGIFYDFLPSSED